MKNYEEVTENVFRKSEEIIKQNRRRRNTIMKIGVSAGCLAIIGTVGAGAWNRGHNAAPAGGVQSIDRDVKQSAVQSEIVCGGSDDGKSKIENEASQSAVVQNGVIILAPDGENPDFHLATMIKGLKIEDNERKIAPENGQIHISKALTAAMEQYGDVDENGKEISYMVVIEYLQNQQTIPATEELYDRESARIKGLCFETLSSDWGKYSEHNIWAGFTKSEIESFTADPDYGYVIELYDNYNGYPISNDDELVIY